MTIEYRVRPVVKYQVTRYESTPTSGSCESQGEFPNEKMAEAVREALIANDRSLQEDLIGYGNPYVLVYKGFDEEVCPIYYASTLEEANERVAMELLAGHEYRLYKRA